jgi:hypothetical protein
MAVLMFSCSQTGKINLAARAAITDPMKVSINLSPMRFLNSTGFRK